MSIYWGAFNKINRKHVQLFVESINVYKSFDFERISSSLCCASERRRRIIIQVQKFDIEEWARRTSQLTSLINFFRQLYGNGSIVCARRIDMPSIQRRARLFIVIYISLKKCFIVRHMRPRERASSQFRVNKKKDFMTKHATLWTMICVCTHRARLC